MPKSVLQLEDENDSCTESNLRIFDDNGITVQSVFKYLKNGRIQEIFDIVQIEEAQFSEIVKACVDTYEEDLSYRPLYCVSNINRKTHICENELNQVHSLFDFALFLADHTFYYDYIQEQQPFSFPYFSYLILVLYGFNTSNSQQWGGIEELFRDHNITFINREREKVAQLFQRAIRDGILKESCIYGEQRHIKYLKYHSVLRPGDKDRLDRILFNHHIVYDENKTYAYLRNLLNRYLPHNIQHENILDALRKLSTRPYFETVVCDFNPDTYQNETITNFHGTNNNNDLLTGSLRFVVDLDQLSIGVWSDIAGSITLNNDDGSLQIFPGRIYYKFYNATAPNLSWTNYVRDGLEYIDPHFHISSCRNREYYFFELFKDETNWLVECPEPEQIQGRCYLLAHPDHEIINQQGAIEVTNFPCDKVFNETWRIYEVPQYNNIQQPEQPEETNYVHVSRECEGTIKIYDAERRKSCFLAEAFPFIKVEGFDAKDITVKIVNSLDDQLEIGFQKRIQGNRIYLYNLELDDCRKIRVFLLNERGEVLNNDSDFVYDILTNDNIEPCERELVKYDKWGRHFSEDATIYYSDNVMYPQQQNTNRNPRPFVFYTQEKKEYSRLMSILYSVGVSGASKNKKYAIPRKKLDNILRYLSEFEGINLSDTKLNTIKAWMKDLGLISQFYDDNGSSFYQCNTARLIPLNKQVAQSTDLLYLLAGVYSKRQYDEILSYSLNRQYKNPCSGEFLSNYIPEYITIGINPDINPCVPISTGNSFTELINYSGNMADFHNEIIGIREPMATNPHVFPSVLTEGRLVLSRTDNYEDLYNISYKVEDSLLSTFCRYSHNDVAWIPIDNGICFPKYDPYYKNCGSTQKKQRYKLPSLVRKALVQECMSIGRDLYAFGVDGILNSFSAQNDELFTALTFFPVNLTRDQKELFCRTIGNGFLQGVRTLTSLQAFAFREIMGSWLLVLCGSDGRSIAFTYREHVYYKQGDCYSLVEASVRRGHEGNSVNTILSSIIHLHEYARHIRGNVYEWKNHYLQLNPETHMDLPPMENIERKQVEIIFKNN